MASNILLDSKNKIATLQINRPEVKNALNLECILELIEAFESLSENNLTGCIILGSQGKEAFCSGADLREFAKKKDLTEKTEYFDALAKLIVTMKNCDKPIITKIHGYALAGGLALVAASDVVLAANDAKFSLPEHKVGMVPGIVMSALEEVINKRTLDYLCLTADVIDSDEALQIGLVSKIYGKTVLDKKTQELADNISWFSKEALSTTKRMLRSASTLETKLNMRAKEMAVYSLNPDCVEGIDAYLTKRKANWK